MHNYLPHWMNPHGIWTNPSGGYGVHIWFPGHVMPAFFGSVIYDAISIWYISFGIFIMYWQACYIVKLVRKFGTWW